MKNNEITKRPDLGIFDRQFPVRLIDAPIYDPTKFTILTGDDGILDDLFSYQVYNHLKNHWRGAAVPTDIQPGMIWSDSDDDKLYHHGAADEEVLQLTRSSDVSPQFATVRLMDTGADHYLDLKCNENLGANRLLNLVVGNAARTITLSGNPTLGDWFDQSVKTTDGPTFARLRLIDTGADHDLILRCNEDLAADRWLYLLVGAANRTLTISGNASINQDTRTTATPSFDHLNLTSATSTLQGGTYLAIEAGASGIRSVTIGADTTVVAADMNITDVNRQIQRSTSAKKYKDKIKDLELDSSIIYNFRVVSFNSICKKDDKNRRFHGLVADDIEQICPEIVHYDENNEVQNYDSQMLMTLILAETQRHETRIKALEAQLNN